MSEDYDGLDLIDDSEERVGTVERTYVDDANNPRFVEIKYGALRPKHRLIPASDAELTDAGALQVPFSRDTIEGSPEAPQSDTLEPADFAAITAYYDGLPAGRGQPENAPAAVAPSSDDEVEPEDTSMTQDTAAGRQFDVVDDSAGGLRVGDRVPAGLEAPTREFGDTIEIPVLEEVLVKQTVVKEILRVKKSDLVEYQTVDGDVRKEQAEVDDEAGLVVESDARAPSS